MKLHLTGGFDNAARHYRHIEVRHAGAAGHRLCVHQAFNDGQGYRH
jgi:hypothetical protein